MEAIRQIQEDFLVCPLCRERYKTPKLLPCMHTFCHCCLTVDLQSKIVSEINPDTEAPNSETEISGKYFHCAVCKAEIHLSIPEGNNNISQWSDLLPDNHFIQSLIEKIDMQSVDQFCESCSEDGTGPGALAEKWCQTCKVAFCESCIRAHDVIKACREHVVISLSEIRSDPLQSIRDHKKEIQCPYHRNKLIEYYCVDCHVSVCSSCVAVQHRKCEMVETIKEAVAKLKPETETVTQDLEAQSDIIQEWEKEHGKELSELTSNKDNLIKEMSALRSKVNEVLLNLENKLVNDLDDKHKQKIGEINQKLKEVEGMKNNVENTSNFVKYLIQYGSDSEIVSVFDTIKVKVEDMKATVKQAKLNKLSTRFKLALDPCIQRLLGLTTLGKIVDVIDLNKENFLQANGHKDKEYNLAERRSSVKRTGTFRVDKPCPPPSGMNNSSSQSSTSSESISSQENAPVRPRRNQPIKPTLRESMGLSARSPANTSQNTGPIRSGTLPRTIRASRPPSVTRTRSSNGTDARSVSSSHETNHRSSVSNIRATSDKMNNVMSPPQNRRQTPKPLPRPASARLDKIRSPTPRIEKEAALSPSKDKNESKEKGLPLMFSFNGRTGGDSKKCWPLDVAVLEDGTPVVTDFHNKKIKAFDATGSVMGEATVPSWPHGIIDVSSYELAVTLPEVSTIVFVVVQENGMRIRKRIRTPKQYRGISCDAVTSPGNPALVVSCCASGLQCIDVLTLDGVLVQSYRNDNRQIGRLLFTWPYYVTCNSQGEIIVSDCQSRNGIICLYRDGNVKYEETLPDNVIQDPRGIYADRNGSLFIADKTGNSIHTMSPDGKYKSPLITANDGLVHPIAVCLSPFGQLIVTQENGEIKVFKNN